MIQQPFKCDNCSGLVFMETITEKLNDTEYLGHIGYICTHCGHKKIIIRAKGGSNERESS